jgi:hypothetical protein
MNSTSGEEKLLPRPHDMLIESMEKDGKPVTTSPIHAPEKPQAPHHFRLLKWPLIAAALLILIPGIIYLVFTGKSDIPNSQVTPIISPVENISPTPTEAPKVYTLDTKDWRQFSSTFNGKKLRLKYPEGVKVTSTTKASEITPEKKVPTILLTNDEQTVTITLEDNAGDTLTDWVAAHGTKQATEPLEMSDRQALLQYTADKLNINAYIPYDTDTVVWTRNTDNAAPGSDEYHEFLTLISTFQIGK